MKGLAFKPPYGLALFHGKNIENRSENCRWNHNGWLVVYSSKTPDRPYYNQAVGVCRSNGWMPPPFEKLERGVLLGVVWFGNRRWGDRDESWGFANHWWFDISEPFMFSEPIVFTPKFGLGLFDIPDELISHELGWMQKQHKQLTLLGDG